MRVHPGPRHHGHSPERCDSPATADTREPNEMLTRLIGGTYHRNRFGFSIDAPKFALRRFTYRLHCPQNGGGRN